MAEMNSISEMNDEASIVHPVRVQIVLGRVEAVLDEHLVLNIL